MKKLLLILFFIGFYCTAQKVSNITTRQEGSSIIISYDLETKLPCKVSLYVSNNGGTTWLGPLKKVTGDVGDKIISGNHTITWNVLEEFEELKGDNIKFQVKATGGEIETIKIGNQEWTTKNLDVTTYRNGDIIPEVLNKDDLYKINTGAWCYYEFESKNGIIYGKLYNCYAILDPRGLAPEGFHIPSVEDWQILRDYYGGERNAVNNLIFNSSLSLKNNMNYFNSIPGGGREFIGFRGIGKSSEWWTTSNSLGPAWLDSREGIIRQNKYITTLFLDQEYKSLYFKNVDFNSHVDFHSVRLIKD